jgi:NTP pyrophosphatase (non-canonical NTP hydrolase)
MDFREYQLRAARTARNAPGSERLHIDLLGLASEAGEVCRLYQKAAERDVMVDAWAVEDELGDVLWRLSDIATVLGLDLEQLAERNISKLRARHPNGFEARNVPVVKNEATGASCPHSLVYASTGRCRACGVQVTGEGNK